MSPPLSTIDPQWAWAAFEPTAETPWSTGLAAHLFRRAGFNADSETLEAAVRQTPAEVIDSLFTTIEPTEYTAEVETLSQGMLATGNAKHLAPWWLHRLLTTPCPLREKATLFWHGHFATSAVKVTDPELMFTQNELLRRHALGCFGPLVQEMSRDPAMLLWLDSDSNRKAHPNENYAREVMELFCLGEGNYTETDVRELARCFTGWEIRLKAFRFNRFQADTGTKTLFGRSGPFTGEQGVELVLERDACPRFLVRKLIRFYLFDEPQASDELIEPLAVQLRESDLEIGPVVQRMLGSNLFFSEHVRARKVRSPVEFGVGLLRALRGSTNVYDLSDGLTALGQNLFHPPNVKGWDGGRAWINSSTLLGRANLVRRLLDHDKTRFDGKTLTERVESIGLSRSDEVVDEFSNLFLAVPLPGDVRRELIRRLDGDRERERGLRETLHLLATQPEFQLA